MKFAQPLLLSLALFAAFPSHAAPDSAELDNIRKAIASAQKDLSAKQAARRQANATLNRTQSQLAQARLNLDSLTRRQQDAWQRLQARKIRSHNCKQILPTAKHKSPDCS